MKCKSKPQRIVKKCNETQRIAMKCSAILQRNAKQIFEYPVDHAKKRKATINMKCKKRKAAQEMQSGSAKKCKAL